MTKFQLTNMLFLEGSLMSVVVGSDGEAHIGIVQSVQRGDGSGHNFNVTMNTKYRGVITIFVRTID